MAIAADVPWFIFQLDLKSAAEHTDYRATIETLDGRRITSVDWIEPLTPDQKTIETPVKSIDLPSGDYVLVLMGKEPDDSYVILAEYPFKIVRD